MEKVRESILTIDTWKFNGPCSLESSVCLIEQIAPSGSLSSIVCLNVHKNESEDIKNIVERVCEILDKKDLFIANYPVGENSDMQHLERMSKSHPPNDVLLLGKSGTGKYRSKYDVFLSFRGEETRASFTSHLYSSLSNAGIVVFKDDADLPRGNSISIDMSLGIKCSTISIIIFSKDYAGSRWCLNELSNIMELHRVEGRIILPVFYGVDPSEVHKQHSSFGKAFRDLIHKISPIEDEVSRWRTDLREAGGITGFVVLNSKNESEDIKKIVEHVRKILDKKDLSIAEHLVRVDSSLQDLIKISESDSMNDVLLLGIGGIGGIGKSTIAKAFYNEIGRTFESRCFLSNIGEVWGQDNGPVQLQHQLLSEICKTKMSAMRSIDSRKIILKEHLCHKRALLVLDDVNEVEQLNALFGSRECFGPGSRIIITSRDKQLLKLLNVDHLYTMKNMDQSESIELFSWHAFKQPCPKTGFIELSRNIVAYSGGVPLVLEVLGSHLFDREMREWKSVLHKLKRIPKDEIQKKLRISFDGLSNDLVKEIFLDISCFFIGMDRSDVTQILDYCGLFPDIGISDLVERSLVTVDEKNKLGMHGLLRDMGREIIRERSPKELGKRSRLWFHKDVHDVLSKHTGTAFVEGLALNLSQTDKDCFSAKAFEEMKSLRLLHLSNVDIDGDYGHISRDLRWLRWHGFPLECIPANFYQKNLVAIELKHSSLRQVWREPEILDKLKILNCSHSPYLMQTPDFTKLPNLEKLVLKNCQNLRMVHTTIGRAHKLLLINLKNCTSLRTLPRSIYNLKSLKTLILAGCAMIERLEEDIEQMDSLTTLVAYETAIRQVPYSLVRLKNLGFISLCGYNGLSRDVFPSLIWSWMSPANNPLSLISTYGGMIISSDILKRKSICDNQSKLQGLFLKITSENDPELTRGAAKILKSSRARICMDKATKIA
ncbi:TMV resistance protein N-like [Neltuma alba]|uniref:TMV resistance protein N-like n=1 Tax=Neltuma alba TaxID=207710 RepID=UPI0010A478B5|nr:TMV resistance protein N-like [Prosopis alba]